MRIKTWVMVSALALTGLTSIPSHAYSSKYECKTVLYDALTKARIKRLVPCASQGGVSYNFCPVKGEAVLDVLIPFSTANHKGTSMSANDVQEPRVCKLGTGIRPYGIPEAGTVITAIN